MRGRGMGPLGFCICLRCGYRVKKEPGVRCMEIRCPRCGAVMIREGSEHHRLYLERKRDKEKL
jgi:ribosomal protein S27AE